MSSFNNIKARTLQGKPTKTSSLKVWNNFCRLSISEIEELNEKGINTCWNLYKSLYFSWKSKFRSSFWSPSKKFWLWMKFGITQWRKGSMSMTMASVGIKTLWLFFLLYFWLLSSIVQRLQKGIIMNFPESST